MTNPNDLDFITKQDKNDLFFLAIKALIINSSGKILLLHDTPRVKIDGTSHTYWDLPGGRVDKNTPIEGTLQREVEEETGVQELVIDELFAAVNSNFRSPVGAESVGLILFVYLCQIPEDAKIIISDEHDNHGWFELEEAAELLSVKYPKELTDKIKYLKTKNA